MIILKYSKIGPNLVRVLNPLTGLYGAISADTGKVVIKPKYSILHEFERGRALVVRNGRYYEIDTSGNEHFDQASLLDKLDNMQIIIIPKADHCPGCFNQGCEFCMGFGFIPLNFKFNDVD